MPPQQAWASRQFIDCESDGKSRAVQCKWCVDKKVAYNSTSRKTSHLKQCIAFNEHIVGLVEAENAGGYVDRELEQVPVDVLEFILDQTGARRLQQQQQHGVGSAPIYGGLRGTGSMAEAARVESVVRAGAAAMRPETRAAPAPAPAPRPSYSNNRATVDRAFAHAVHDSGVPLNAFNATSHPAMIDTLRLLDKDTRVRIARELLDEAYEEVKRSVDNYIEKQQYLKQLVDEGDLPERMSINDPMN